MSVIEAIILGIIQGLTEFLPVSSSGHIELGKAFLDIQIAESLTFSIILHAATVLSTFAVFHKEIISIFKGLFQFRWNNETQFVFHIVISLIPVLILAVFLKDTIEQLFQNQVILVGAMLIVTAMLLALTQFAKKKAGPIRPVHALVIGIAQAIAVLPGISRSGATISTGILLGNDKSEVTKFSFLMVIIPILGAAFLDLKDSVGDEAIKIDPVILVSGFLAAFVSGYLACKLMLNIVRKQKLIYFSIYCLLIGATAIIFGLVN